MGRLLPLPYFSQDATVSKVFSPALDLGKMPIFKQKTLRRYIPRPKRSQRQICVFSGS